MGELFSSAILGGLSKVSKTNLAILTRSAFFAAMLAIAGCGVVASAQSSATSLSPAAAADGFSATNTEGPSNSSTPGSQTAVQSNTRVVCNGKMRCITNEMRKEAAVRAAAARRETGRVPNGSIAGGQQ